MKSNISRHSNFVFHNIHHNAFYTVFPHMLKQQMFREITVCKTTTTTTKLCEFAYPKVHNFSVLVIGRFS